MANPEHLAILAGGVQVWNTWREENPLVIPDLSKLSGRGANLYGANFSNANLVNAYLAQADLRLARFSKAVAREAFFSGANLYGARMDGADLSGAYFTGCNLHFAVVGDAEPEVCVLREADFTRAILQGAALNHADLTMANLEGADLSGAYLQNTILANVRTTGMNFTGTHFGDNVLSDLELSGVLGLDRIDHVSPSNIDLRTLAKGSIPDYFLRGIGLPDTLIDYAHSLSVQPVEFHSCFVSYSTKDQEFADQVYADLQGNGVRCWFAPHHIKGGRKIHEQIDEAIRVYDRLLLILSDHSMSSEWVKTEIANTRQREIREKRQMLFPITLVPYARIKEWRAFDADAGKDSAREIREYFIPDFSDWKNHDSYQKAFQRLLRDLKAERNLTR